MGTGYGQWECVWGVGGWGTVAEGGCLRDQFSEKEEGPHSEVDPQVPGRITFGQVRTCFI